MGPDAERPGRPVDGQHGPVRQSGAVLVPSDELHADGVHHGEDRQEREGVVNLAQTLFKQSRGRVSTGTLNRILREAVEKHPPPSRENRTPRVYYGTQVGVSPPTVVLFVNSTKLFEPTYQRYLLNVFRERLPFRDIPIKLYMRSRRQSEEGSRSPGEDEEKQTARISPEVTPGLEEHAVHSRQGVHFDVARRFLNREVNELLSELEN